MEKSLSDATVGRERRTADAPRLPKRQSDASWVATRGIDRQRLPSPDDYLALRPPPDARQRVLLAMMRADGSLIRLPRVADTAIRTGRIPII